jgi:hypothetical protein
VSAAEAPAGDTQSGVDGYSYVFDRDPDTIPDTVKDVEESATVISSGHLASGIWYFHLRTVDNAGNWSTAVHLGPFQIDHTKPSSLRIGRLAAFQRSVRFALTWSGLDAHSGIRIFDVRFREAPEGKPFGNWRTWNGRRTGPTAGAFTGTPGSTYCFAARAVDNTGNRSGWSRETCTALPIDDVGFEASEGWDRLAGGRFYEETVSRSTTAGATLTRARLSAKRISLLATAMPGGGTVEIYWNHRLLKRINLGADGIGYRELYTVATFPRLEVGTLEIRVVGSRQVQIDGVGVSRR